MYLIRLIAIFFSILSVDIDCYGFLVKISWRTSPELMRYAGQGSQINGCVCMWKIFNAVSHDVHIEIVT